MRMSACLSFARNCQPETTATWLRAITSYCGSHIRTLQIRFVVPQTYKSARSLSFQRTGWPSCTYLKAKVDSGSVKKPSPGKSPAAWGASAAILADFTSDPHEDGKILVTKVTLDTRKLICQRLAPDSDTMSVEANCPKCGMPCYGLVKPRLIAPTDSQSFWSLPMQMFLEDEDDLYRRLSVRQ